MRLTCSSNGVRRGSAGLPSTSVSTTAVRGRKEKKTFTVLKTGIRIGGDNHLAVLLQPYAPTVHCEDSDVPLSRESCAMIEFGMEADDEQRLFGDESLDPAVEEALPHELLSSEVPPPQSPSARC